MRIIIFMLLFYFILFLFPKHFQILFGRCLHKMIPRKNGLDIMLVFSLAVSLVAAMIKPVLLDITLTMINGLTINQVLIQA